MRKELGKWLMDIAKYIITAVVLSSVFGAIESWVMYLTGVISVAATLIVGLYLVSDRPIWKRRKKVDNDMTNDTNSDND